MRKSFYILVLTLVAGLANAYDLNDKNGWIMGLSVGRLIPSTSTDFKNSWYGQVEFGIRHKNVALETLFGIAEPKFNTGKKDVGSFRTSGLAFSYFIPLHKVPELEPYVKLGVASHKITPQANFVSKSHTGMLAALGINYHLNEIVSIKAEVKRMNHAGNINSDRRSSHVISTGFNINLSQLPSIKCKTKSRRKVIKIVDKFNLNYDFNKDKVTPKHNAQIKTLASYLKKSPNKKIVLIGHSDRLGAPYANALVSKKRACNVKEFLHLKYGISPNRVKCIGLGYSKPVTEKLSMDSQALNRRVEAKLDVER